MFLKASALNTSVTFLPVSEAEPNGFSMAFFILPMPLNPLNNVPVFEIFPNWARIAIPGAKNFIAFPNTIRLFDIRYHPAISLPRPLD